MHWEALVFYVEPRALILGGTAVIGTATIEVDSNNCSVSVGNIEYTVIGVEDLHHLAGLHVQGIKPLTAYPSKYMDAVDYFLSRMGLPKYMYKVVNADPRAIPLKAANPESVVRNIAYLHGLNRIIIANWKRLGKPKTSHVLHAILKASGYNADPDYARYYPKAPCRAKLA